MKAVGLDTCVVVRLLTGEPRDQAEVAEQYLEECHLTGMGVMVSDMVVAEAYHALAYHYEVPKTEAAKALLSLLSSPLVTSTGHAVSVLESYHGRGAGLVDRMIRMDLLDHAHEVATFDHDFARLQNVRKLSRE